MAHSRGTDGQAAHRWWIVQAGTRKRGVFEGALDVPTQVNFTVLTARSLHKVHCMLQSSSWAAVLQLH